MKAVAHALGVAAGHLHRLLDHVLDSFLDGYGAGRYYEPTDTDPVQVRISPDRPLIDVDAIASEIARLAYTRPSDLRKTVWVSPGFDPDPPRKATASPESEPENRQGVPGDESPNR